MLDIDLHVVAREKTSIATFSPTIFTLGIVNHNLLKIKPMLRNCKIRFTFKC